MTLLTYGWRVERAGSPGGYLRGWIAYNLATGVGSYFTSWRDAIDYANAEAGVAAVRDLGMTVHDLIRWTAEGLAKELDERVSP